MFDIDDYIIKSFYGKDGKHKPQRWYHTYCNKCGKSRGYLPKNKDRKGLCLSCSCIGRTISESQKQSISIKLNGRKKSSKVDRETRKRAAIKSVETRRLWSEDKKKDIANKMAASKIGISIDEYLLKKEEISIRRKLSHNMRTQIYHCLKETIGQIRHVNWSVEELKKHLESQMESGMNWDNYGRKKNQRCWEIDHIIPINSRNEDGSYYWKNLEDPNSEDFKRCFSLDNLQPMWAEENNKKNNRR